MYVCLDPSEVSTLLTKAIEKGFHGSQAEASIYIYLVENIHVYIIYIYILQIYTNIFIVCGKPIYIYIFIVLKKYKIYA